MGLIYNGAQRILPRQQEDNDPAFYAQPWSLERDNQLRNLLASGIHAYLGAGWLTPAVLTAGVGHAVKIPAGNTLYVGGVAWTLDSDLICNGTATSATNTIWATLVPGRPAPNTTREQQDTYTPDIVATQDGNPPVGAALPGDAYARSGSVVVDGGGAITSIVQNVALIALSNYIRKDGSVAFAADQSMGGHKLTSLATPTAVTDAVTKAYADALGAGLKLTLGAKAATGSNVASLSGTTTMDGVALVATDRAFLYGQSTATQNGLWVINAGAWTRPADFATGDHAQDLFVFVQPGGTLNGGDSFACYTASPNDVIGTNNLTFTQVGEAQNVTAGNGLTQVGNVFHVTPNADGSIVSNADDVQVGIINDAQHGTRGGGSTHAAATDSVAGFMSAADKTKLDGVASNVSASAPIVFGALGALPSALTRYLAPGSGGVSVNEVKIRILTPFTLHRMAVRVSVAPGGAITDTYTLRKNGVDQAMTVSVTAAAVEAEDTAHTVSFASGDDLSVKLVSGLLTAAQDAIVSLFLA